MNRYSLCAIDLDSSNEYIIDLFQYKNNKSPLAVLDFGTSHFKDERDLINYLYNSKKIPSKNVKLYIKHGDKNIRRLPVIYNDEFILNLTNPDNTFIKDDKVVSEKIKNDVTNKHLDYLNDESYFDNFKLSYMFCESYMSDRFFNQSYEYRKNYIEKEHKSSQLKSNTFDILKKEVKSYKSYRTLYYTIKYGIDLSIYNDFNKNKETNEPFHSKFIMSNDEIINEEESYYSNNMDEFYSVYDLDDKGKKL